mgnify:FL=1
MDTLLQDRIGVVVRLVGRPGTRPILLDAINEYMDRLVEEPGTEAYVVSIDPEHDDMVWLHEWFRDETAVAAHQQAPAFVELMHVLRDALDQPPAILRFAPIRMHLADSVLEGDGVPRVVRPRGGES